MSHIREVIAAAELLIEMQTGVSVCLFMELTDRSADHLLKQCCDAWSIELDYIKEKSRSHDRVRMRFILAMLLDKKTDLKTMEIASYIGYNTHCMAIRAKDGGYKYLREQEDEFMALYNPVKHLFDEVQANK